VTAAPTPEPRRARLNPFAFPSDTTFRFVLLVVAVLGTTFFVWNWIYFAVGGHGGRFARAALACLQVAPAQSVNLDDYTNASDAYGACVQDLTRPTAWWMLGGAALVLGLALALTLAQPWWRRRRLRLRPLTAADAPGVVAAVTELAAEAGLRQTPTLVWDPLDPAPSGLAFGYAGNYTVALTGGLVVRQATDPDAFRAVVRHELAHIRNRDVDVTYFTVSLWHAFLLGAVLPFVFTLFDEGLDTILRVSWRLAALGLLVYLTRNAVLRSREVYADVRASAAPGAADAVRRVLSGLPQPRRGAHGLLRVHPDPGRRLAAVEDTGSLFTLHLLTAFGAGLAATIAYESAVDLVSSFVSDGVDMRLVAALAFAPAVVGVVGVAVWRSGFGALAEGRRPPPVWPLGLALAAGFMVGPELALRRSVATGDDAMLSELLHGRGFAWAIGLVLALVLSLAWVSAGASAWIRSLAGRHPRLAVFGGLLAASGVLTIVMGIFYIARDVRPVTGIAKHASSLEHQAVSHVAYAGPEWVWQLVMNPELVWLLLRWEILPAVVLLWAYPYAAALLRRRPASDAETGWAFLDPGGRLAIPPFAAHLVRPLAIGVAAGVAFLVAEVCLRVGIRVGVDGETRTTNELLYVFFAWQLVFAIVAQGAAGAVATALSGHRARVVDGLAAAFVAGSIAVFGIVAGPSAGSCFDPIAVNSAPCAWTVDAGFTWDVYRRLIAEGAIAAALAGVVTLGLLALARRREPAEELAPAGIAG
jgi:Zn-dependent protease with chaperone function